MILGLPKIPTMFRVLFLAGAAACYLARPVYADEILKLKPGQARPELKCSQNDTPEEEEKKQILYQIGKMLYMEYCSNGQKEVISDDGDNG